MRNIQSVKRNSTLKPASTKQVQKTGSKVKKHILRVSYTVLKKQMANKIHVRTNNVKILQFNIANKNCGKEPNPKDRKNYPVNFKCHIISLTILAIKKLTCEAESIGNVDRSLC